MLDQFIQFATNHYMLVSVFSALLIAFMLNESKQGGASVSPTGLVTAVNREEALVLDVRDNKEFSQGHIAGAINIPLSAIDGRAAELDKYKAKPIIVVCKIGQTAGAAGKKLRTLGFEDVRRLSGGMTEWSSSSLPVVKK